MTHFPMGQHDPGVVRRAVHYGRRLPRRGQASVQCGTSSGDDEVIDQYSPGSSSATTPLKACYVGERRVGATVGLWG